MYLLADRMNNKNTTTVQKYIYEKGLRGNTENKSVVGVKKDRQERNLWQTVPLQGKTTTTKTSFVTHTRDTLQVIYS